jgi:integrase
MNVLRQVIGMSDLSIEIPRVRGKKSSPRGYFDLEEYRTIRDKSKEMDGFRYKDYNGTWYTIDLDLHDFIIFMVGSSLRPTVGEVFSLQHKDIKTKSLKDTSYLEFPLVRKNRSMLVQTLSTSYFSYRDICKRRKNYTPEDYIFLPLLKNRRTSMKRMGRNFKVLLKELEMELGNFGEKRTPYSLRHTSLLFNLSQPNPDLLDICRRSDTSMKMIDDFYYPIVSQNEKLEQFLRI